MSRSVTAVACLFVVVFCGCENSEQKARIEQLEKRVADQDAHIASLEKRVDEMAQSAGRAFSNIQQVQSGIETLHADLTGSSPKPAEATKTVEIISVDARPGEVTTAYTEYAWKLTVRNNSSVPQLIDAEIKFEDSEGFELKDATAYKLAVPAGGSETFTGTRLLSPELARRFAKVAAVISRS